MSDYFHNQPESFKRAWLGAKRYEAYKDGKLSEKAIFAPDLSFRASVEDLRLDGKTLREALRDSEIHEHFNRDDLEEKLKKRESSEMLEGFEEQKTTKKAEEFIKEKLIIDADYSKLPVEVANDMNQELVRARNMFGTVGIIENIKTDADLEKRGAFGSYDKKTKTILLRPKYGRLAAALYIQKAPEGRFSTRSPLHGYRHEIGHALLYYCEQVLPHHERTLLVNELKQLHNQYFVLSKEGHEQISVYAGDDYKEMVAEAIAQILGNSASILSRLILQILKGAGNVWQ